MIEFFEGLKVWVRHSNCGYKGPAIVVGGPLHGSSWLVQAVKGDERLFVAKAEFLDVMKESSEIEGSDLEDKKEIKKKQKAERKSHQPRGDRRR